MCKVTISNIVDDLNDTMDYYKFKDSQFVLVSLDTKECFCSVCHVLLFLEVINALP